MAVSEAEADQDTWLGSFPSDWLDVQTGHDLEYWITRIQQIIPEASIPTSDPEHDFSFPVQWIDVIAKELWLCFRWQGIKDENMWFAASLSMILGGWYSAVQRAKYSDPARPKLLRQQVHGRWLHWVQAMIATVVQDFLQPRIFPGQKWDNPFHPEAQDGWFR